MILGIRGWYSTHERPFNCIDHQKELLCREKMDHHDRPYLHDNTHVSRARVVF